MWMAWADDGGGSSGSGGSAEQFCAASAEAEALFEDIDPFDPEAVEAAAKKNLELLEAAIPIAPAEVRDDLITIRENFDDYLAVLEDNGWDFFAAAPEIEELESRSEPAAAGDRRPPLAVAGGRRPPRILDIGPAQRKKICRNPGYWILGPRSGGKMQNPWV